MAAAHDASRAVRGSFDSDVDRAGATVLCWNGESGKGRGGNGVRRRRDEKNCGGVGDERDDWHMDRPNWGLRICRAGVLSTRPSGSGWKGRAPGEAPRTIGPMETVSSTR